MARPKIDHAVYPNTAFPSMAHRRLTVSRIGINESAYMRIDRILRGNIPLAESVANMIGDLQGVRRHVETADMNALRSWLVDAVAEGMAILACYDE